MEGIGGASRRVAHPWRSISQHDKRREAPLIDELCGAALGVRTSDRLAKLLALIKSTEPEFYHDFFECHHKTGRAIFLNDPKH